MAQHKPTKRDEAKRAKRRLIVASAMACFIERGIAQTGIRDIAERANISLGNLYNHFANKDELIAEIARQEAEALAPLIALVQQETPDGTTMTTFIDRYVDATATPAHAILSVEILAAALRQPELATPFEENRHALVAALSRQTTFPKVRLELMLDAMDALAMRCGLEGRKPNRAEKAALHRLVEALI